MDFQDSWWAPRARWRSAGEGKSRYVLHSRLSRHVRGARGGRSAAAISLLRLISNAPGALMGIRKKKLLFSLESIEILWDPLEFLENHWDLLKSRGGPPF